MRHELSAAERSQQTARRKELYEALHPETALGGVGRGQTKVRHFGEPSVADRFTKATAAATGQSERNIQRDARRGEKLSGDLPRIKGTSLDSPGEMDALIKMKPEGPPSPGKQPGRLLSFAFAEGGANPRQCWSVSPSNSRRKLD